MQGHTLRTSRFSLGASSPPVIMRTMLEISCDSLSGCANQPDSPSLTSHNVYIYMMPMKRLTRRKGDFSDVGLKQKYLHRNCVQARVHQIIILTAADCAAIIFDHRHFDQTPR